MLAQKNIIIPRERSLVDLVFKTFSNWGKAKILPVQLLPSQLLLCNPFLFRLYRIRPIIEKPRTPNILTSIKFVHILENGAH